MQLKPKTASVVPPEDGRLAPETCRELRRNKVIVKVEVRLRTMSLDTILPSTIFCRLLLN